MKLFLWIDANQAVLRGRMEGEGGIVGDYAATFPRGTPEYDQLEGMDPGEVEMDPP